MNNNSLFILSSLPELLSKKELVEYFKKYKLGDKKSRNEIIKHNIRLVINQVYRFGITPYEKSELISVGLIGLIKSIDSFNLEKKVEFSTYASSCINNEILMFMRRNKKHTENISLNQTCFIDSEGNEISLGDTLSYKDNECIKDNNSHNRIIRNIIKELPIRERKIVLLYFGFIDNRIYTQSEIADIIGLSKSQISRLLKSILIKIESKYKDIAIKKLKK